MLNTRDKFKIMTLKHYLSTVLALLIFTLGESQINTIQINATTQHSGGFMRIEYANGGTVLRKPLIVIEGFDAGNILKPELQYGLSSIEDFIIDVKNDDAVVNGVLVQSPLHKLLDGNLQEYDIVYVDYANGTDWIQRNVSLVEDVIQRVNTMKLNAGSNQPNVVLGISMGGLCARYALRDMENNGQDHQTRLYISWDSPHQGANVPEGYQRLVRHVRDLYISTAASTGGVANLFVPAFTNVNPRKLLNIADEPASKQMLINRVGTLNTIDNSTHDSWQTELKNLGYPQGFAGGFPFRRIAVSNGSECAKPQDFNPGDNLLSLQGNASNLGLLSEVVSSITLPTVGTILNQPMIVLLGPLPGRNKFNLDFAVNSKAFNTGNQVYKGKITYQKNILGIIPVMVVLTNRSFNANASTLPYDYYPGGNINIGDHGFNFQSSTAPNWVG
jgi:hypothetical protein